MIKITTISGTVQTNNRTANTLALVVDELNRFDDVVVTEIWPSNMKLAIPGSAMDDSDRSQLQKSVINADGVILATPEYHGTFSSLMKLTIENMGYPSVLKGKPVIILGVAGGSIGAVKSIEHLRSVCAHIGALVLPGSISIANVQSVFDKQGLCIDEEVGKLIRKVATRIIKYIVDTSCPEKSFEEMVRGELD